MFQYSLEMLRKIRVRGDRSGTAASDMKIRQWEGKRESPPISLALRNVVWCKAGYVWSGRGFSYERVTKAIMGK